jgi:drug/metabolite transporter (DMT)-like permease
MVALLYTAPAFVAIFSWFILKEQMTRTKIIAVLLSITGAFLIMGIWTGEPLFGSRTQIGDWMAIGAGLGYSTWYIFGKKLGKNREAAVISFFGLSIGALMLLPLVFMLGGLHLPQNLRGWSLVAAVGIIPTSMAFLLYFAGLRLIEATKASIFAIIEPLTAAILAFIFLGETLSYDSLLGLALIVASVLLISISKE